MVELALFFPVFLPTQPPRPPLTVPVSSGQGAWPPWPPRPAPGAPPAPVGQRLPVAQEIYAKGWGGDVTPRGLSSSGRPFDKIRNLSWPCNVKGGGSPRAPVAQGAGLSPAPTQVRPAPGGAPHLKGLRTGPNRGRRPDRLGARLDVTGVQNGRVSPRPHCEYWDSSTSPTRGPRTPTPLPTSPPAPPLPSQLAISGKLVFPPGAPGLRLSEGAIGSSEHALQA